MSMPGPDLRVLIVADDPLVRDGLATTVKFHLHSAMGKLGAQSRTEAVVWATRLGLLLL